MIERAQDAARGWPRFARAAAFGSVAAIAGATLYYAVIAITNFEIGLVAIVIGFMVGFAVMKGTGGYGSRRYQLLAVFLTYFAVGLAYLPLAMKQTATTSANERAGANRRHRRRRGADPATAGRCGWRDRDAVAPDAGAAGADRHWLAASGLLSALIIGIGMRQAWRMTGAPALGAPYPSGPDAPTPAP